MKMVRLDDCIHASLSARAEATGVPIAEQVRRVMRAYVGDVDGSGERAGGVGLVSPVQGDGHRAKRVRGARGGGTRGHVPGCFGLDGGGDTAGAVVAPVVVAAGCEKVCRLVGVGNAKACGYRGSGQVACRCPCHG